MDNDAIAAVEVIKGAGDTPKVVVTYIDDTEREESILAPTSSLTSDEKSNGGLKYNRLNKLKSGHFKHSKHDKNKRNGNASTGTSSYISSYIASYITFTENEIKIV